MEQGSNANFKTVVCSKENAKQSRTNDFINYLKKDWQLFLLLIPGLVFVFIFNYIPMYGILMAFQDYSPFKGILGSTWVGFKHFHTFINSYYFWELIVNTLRISVTSIILDFPSAIILALMINELKNKHFKKIVQTVSYFPHFISLVIVVGMLVQFTSPSDGLVNQVIKAFGGKSINFMIEPEWFVPLYIITGIWKNVGWGSIIYLAALSSVETEQYEAAIVDGASRIKQIMYISLPSILPTIVIMLILQVGRLMSVSFEKILLMYNELNWEVSDVINTYIYRMGIQNQQYSLSTAIGLFQTTINAVLVVGANYLSRKLTETSLW